MTATVFRYCIAPDTLAGVIANDEGDFVRYDDIKHLLAVEPTEERCVHGVWKGDRCYRCQPETQAARTPQQIVDGMTDEERQALLRALNRQAEPGASQNRISVNQSQDISMLADEIIGTVVNRQAAPAPQTLTERRRELLQKMERGQAILDSYSALWAKLTVDCNAEPCNWPDLRDCLHDWINAQNRRAE